MTPTEEIEEIIELLFEYDGDSLIDMVRDVLAEVNWLKDELMLAQQQLQVATEGSRQVLTKLHELQKQLNQGDTDEQARQTETKA